jgi:prophage regulatory protein
MTAIPPGKMLLTRDDLPRLGITISPSTLLRLEAAGEFPRRIRLGRHSVAWIASEIEGHIAQLAAARTADR